MTTPVVQVYVDLRGAPHFVGHLYVLASKGCQGATLRYADSWLRNPERYALEPGLTLGAGPHHTAEGRALFGAIGDSAPDRWGRTLIARAERLRAKAEDRTPRTLLEIDYLLGVLDEARSGALRFRLTEGGPFLAVGGASHVPPLMQLRALLDAAARAEDDSILDEDMRLLLAPGSSLGGARPKASVRDGDGTLSVAKLPAIHDTYNAVRWEGVALAIAHRAGVVTPKWRLERVGDREVLITARFDRDGQTRIPFLSAMSMLGATDRDVRSYLEIADALRQHGAATGTDLPQLWRRLVLNVLVSNTDDHLRNHGFLYAGTAGWRLAPAYDLNPVPTDVKPRVLATAIGPDEDLTASLELALSVAADFDLRPENARQVAAEVGAAVARWRTEGERFGAGRAELDRMASAFEHDDLRLALGTQAGRPAKKTAR
ncbi:MAG TPA: HipA domain-containing protein [Gemmatimonadales bacterium]|nr:HipA domain-containing protein [Gemmatimonadales bacterium]